MNVTDAYNTSEEGQTDKQAEHPVLACDYWDSKRSPCAFSLDSLKCQTR